MKKLTPVLITIMLFSGCGKDGSDGLAFIQYYNAGSGEVVDFETTDLNYTIDSWRWDVEYQQIEPSTHEYTLQYLDYLTNDTLLFEGIYEITVNKGGSASGMDDGVDGKDRYYNFWIDRYGVDFEYSYSL